MSQNSNTLLFNALLDYACIDMTSASAPETTPTMPRQQMDPKIIYDQILKIYTTKSKADIADIFSSLYSDSTKFIDPFVYATPRTEARLQFLALHHLFSSVLVTSTSEPRIIDEPPHSSTHHNINAAMDVHFDYYWNRQSWFGRTFLPKVTPLDATIELAIDPTTGRILRHIDHWNSPKPPILPEIVRKINVKATNAVFRMLGWDHQQQEGEDQKEKVG